MNADAPAAAPSGASRRGGVVATVACIGIAAIAAGQALVSHPPNLWFDVDPAADPNPFAGIAPSTGLLLDSLSLALSALAVIGVRRGVDRVGAVLVALAAVGALAAGWHASRGADDALRGLQWCSAMFGAAAIAASVRALPASRARVLRAVLVGILAGAAVPMAVRGALQLWHEHPAMVEQFRLHKAEVLAGHGWSEGSPQALTYERRVMQPEATAWFGMSNVASGVLAAAALALAGGALALRRLRPLGTVLLGGAGILCAALVAVNGSKGAIGALGLACAFGAWCALRSPQGRTRAWVAVAMVAAVVAAVALRGTVGEGAAERSLLFRSHYADGAARAFVAHPFTGVGPAGFADAYLAVRPDRSPEEVQSAHAAWADWLASLGIAGAAWIALLAALVSIAALGSMHRGEVPRDGATAWTRGPLVAALAVLAASVVAIVPEAHALDERSLAVRVLAALLGASLAGASVRAALVGGRLWSACIASAALLVAMHAQVEMLLWWPGAVAWVAALLGTAAVDPTARPQASRGAAGAAVTAAALAGGVAGMGFASFEAARRAEAQVMDAALPLALHARARLGEDVPRVLPVDHARFQAASGLLRGGEDRWMARPSLVAAALEQAASSVSGQGADASIEARSARCRQVLGLAVVGFRADAPERVASAAALVAEAVLAQPAECADRAWVEGFLRTAAERQVACNPRSVRGWARLAEWHVRAGDASAAQAAAARALAADDSYELDPLRRIPAGERERLRAIAGGEVISPAPSARPR